MIPDNSDDEIEDFILLFESYAVENLLSYSKIINIHNKMKHDL